MIQFDDRIEQSKIGELHHREEEALVAALSAKRGLPYIDLYGISIDTDALILLAEPVSREGELAIFLKNKQLLSVAVRNPQNPETERVLGELTTRGFEIRPYMASLRSIEHAWERYNDTQASVAEKRGVLDIDPMKVIEFAKTMATHLDVAEKLTEVKTANSAERISQTIEVLFGGALALGASDIHIEPEAIRTRIRYRVDGVLLDISDMDKSIYTLLVSRLKLLSGLKLNVRSMAQDGRFTFDIGERKIEVRSSVIPGGYGETMVMRLLDPDATGFRYDLLGLNSVITKIVEEELARPTGTLITTGPTGSGKTTALYAFMQRVHSDEVKIITIEDPIEYKLPGVVQTQVSGDYTFASGLRAVLRQDPDIIMVGEIRDREVAETAMNAALTGHYVFSTLHTNSAVGAFPRLIDLGIDPRTIGSAVNLVMGQRLVRKLCDHCKKEREATTEEQKLIARIIDRPVAIHSIFETGGCDVCNHSGYKGRIGIFEAVRVDSAVEDAILRDPRESVILEAAKSQGIPSMQQDGVMKVLGGITTLDELGRVIDLHNSALPTSEPSI